jgi:glycosyltransferase involved in cell wall biosynthesis
VVEGHARRLREHGFECTIATPDEPPARGRRFDVGVATWWETAEPLARLDCERRVVFLQSLEHLWYGQDEPLERLAAALPLLTHTDFLAVSSWLAELVPRLHPGAICRVVPNGVDKEVFAPRERPARDGGPLRVLVEGQPSVWLKGIPEAVAAVRAMREPAELTLVALSPDGTEDAGADRVVVGLDPAEMAGLYAESDVLLKLSRVEGLAMAPLEALHTGLPCVVAAYTGHEDYLVHGENGLVVGYDDVEGTAGALDLLARDRALLARLGDGARRSAEAWPGLDRSTGLLAEALREIASAPRPAADPSGAGLLELVRQTTELARPGLSGLRGSLAWNEAALREARGRVHDLSVERDEHAAQLGTITASRLYRAISRGRDLLGRKPPWPRG